MKRYLQTIISLLFIVLFGSACTRENNVQTLTYSTWGSQSEIQVMKPIIADFEVKNNVKVKLIYIPQNYFQKLHLLFASNQAPDVIFINNYYLPVYAKAGLLEDVSAYFKEEFENKTFFQNAVNALSLNDKKYGIPRDISNMVVYYNKDIFLQNKTDYPNKNWNYKDLRRIASRLTQKDKWGIGFEENPIFWEPILWSNGGGIFANDGELILNSQESKKALNYCIELKTKYHVAPTQIESANRTMAQMFLDEKVAMIISGRWLVPKFREEASFDWDIINLPQGTKGSIAGSDSSGWAISKSAKDKELAARFIKHMSSKATIEKFTKSGLITPARKDCAYSNIFLDNQKPKSAKIFLDINENAIVTPIPDKYNQKIERLTKLLEPYFLGEKKISPSTQFEL